MKKVTDAHIRSLKGEEKMREVLIDQRLFLRVKLLKSGETKKKWFICYYDAAGRRQRNSIGEYPALGLADALLRAYSSPSSSSRVGRWPSRRSRRDRVRLSGN